MSNPRTIQDMTGLQVPKKTHRGKRSRGKSAKLPGLGTNKSVQHFEALKGAMAKGDNASAKIASLHLANALHSIGKKGKSSLPSPEADSMKPALITDGQPAVQGTGDTV